jgi:hypothetical protein
MDKSDIFCVHLVGFFFLPILSVEEISIATESTASRELTAVVQGIYPLPFVEHAESFICSEKPTTGPYSAHRHTGTHAYVTREDSNPQPVALREMFYE